MFCTDPMQICCDWFGPHRNQAAVLWVERPCVLQFFDGSARCGHSSQRKRQLGLQRRGAASADRQKPDVRRAAQRELTAVTRIAHVASAAASNNRVRQRDMLSSRPKT